MSHSPIQFYLQITLSFISLLLFQSKLSAEDTIIEISPPIVGEVHNYKIGWSFITVGNATLEIFDEAYKEEEAYLIRMTAKTTSFADKIYKVRTRIDSYVDKQMTHSLLFEKDQNEGGKHKIADAQFDWEKKLVTYTDRNGTRDSLSISEQIFDPLSIVVAVRGMSFDVGDTLALPVTNGKKKIITEIKVLKREKIKVPAGKFTALKLKPETKDMGGVFKKSKNADMFIWVSDDPSHRLLRMKSKVAVGSFKAELESLEGPGAKEFLKKPKKKLKKKKL